ncbi:MAG: hypothetical protein PW789_04520 [Edaphobacter sp.]|uniref:hypothetical protein n=1 Tax=Edaphobacter sp. TaxID=1934404 RepID=UPI0023A36990|nr:hypothetical protein [Edaphobacter sp.]MDE1175852.1 hypothetical protein [Edaphobacter sp.]
MRSKLLGLSLATLATTALSAATSLSAATLSSSTTAFSVPTHSTTATSVVYDRGAGFGGGQSSVMMKGTLRGSNDVSYLVGAHTGQTLTVTLKGSTWAYFDVYAPGDADAAIYTSDSAPTRNHATLRLPANGNYIVHVYRYRNEMLRKPTSPYTVTIGVQ